MRRIELQGEREVTAPGSVSARVRRLAGDAHVVVIEVGPGGVVARHPAGVAQLFAVVRGSGWVSGGDGEREPIRTGEAVLWEPGEEHESGSVEGMTALVVEAETLDLSDEPKRVVADGYDAIAECYAEWAASFESPTMHWVEKLLESLEGGSEVLELGCGGGSPATQRLAERNRVHGVDISPRQVERARKRVPGATFECADAMKLELDPASFDAVVSLYMLGHVPRAEQGPLLESIAAWLREGGYLLTTMGTANADDEVDPDWLGAPMFFASFDEAENRRMLANADFELIESKVIPIEEPGHGVVSFMWVLARKSQAGRRRAAAARRRPDS